MRMYCSAAIDAADQYKLGGDLEASSVSVMSVGRAFTRKLKTRGSQSTCTHIDEERATQELRRQPTSFISSIRNSF